MKAKRRKRLSRPGNNFGHICFKMFLPTYCVFMLKANLDPYFHIFFPLNCISCKYGFFVKIWVPPEISQDVFVQTSPNLPQILRHDILQTYWAKFSLTEKYLSFEELIFSRNELVAMATLMIKTQFCSISLKCFLSRSMFLKTSSVGCILCFKFEGAEERFKNDSLCIC